MNYTLDNIQTAPSYDALKRNGFSDFDVVAYYGTPMTDRGAMFIQIKSGNQAEKFNAPRGSRTVTPIVIEPTQISRNSPTAKFASQGTQKCTVNSLTAMVAEHMNKNFEYKGTVYNMRDLGWDFKWVTTKNAFGRCYRKIRRNRFTGERTITTKEIQLSSWLVKNSKADFSSWVDTMLHEIAHAIDVERRGCSDHSWAWKDIAYAIGCDGERTTDVEIDADASKYTISCPNGHKKAGHKYSSSIAQGRQSCNKCSNSFDRRYTLTQIQNY